MPCSRQPFDEVCRAPVSVQRACRHAWMTECVNRSSKDVPVCRELIKKTLPCNHLALVECSVSTDDIFCNEICDHVLACQHSVPTRCGVSMNQRYLLTCPIKELKELPCGHIYTFNCGSYEATISLDSLYCR
jgi:hypothetical protein